MSSDVSLDSRVRHRVFAAIYEAAQLRRTEAERERAALEAHAAAERAMQGFDEWMTGAALYVVREGQRRGFPDAITEAAARRVLSAIGQAVLEAAP